jgi:Fur family peroxide stress response transcriptional regulator
MSREVKQENRNHCFRRKHSSKRDAILEVLKSTSSHPAAQWVYEKLKPRIPDLSLGTVYRNISLFIKEGTLVSVGVVDGEERFDAVTHPHSHLICTCCSRVFDLSVPDLSVLKAAAESREKDKFAGGALIDYRKTVFYGLCNECAYTELERPV